MGPKIAGFENCVSLSSTTMRKMHVQIDQAEARLKIDIGGQRTHCIVKARSK